MTEQTNKCVGIGCTYYEDDDLGIEYCRLNGYTYRLSPERHCKIDIGISTAIEKTKEMKSQRKFIQDINKANMRII